MRLYDPCEPTNEAAKFLRASEILSKINYWSGMRLSIKRLLTAMHSLNYGKPISKRINGSPKKVYSVIERTDMD